MNIKKDFIFPPNEYTPFPFWFWNDELNEKEIKNQIVEFKMKGIDGFIIHPRIGLPKRIGYLGDVFFKYIRFAVETAANLDMKVILYDEGMYPSGAANGKVVRDYPEYAAKGLRVLSPDKVSDFPKSFEQHLLYFKIENDQVKKIEPNKFFEEKIGYLLAHQESQGTIRGIHYGEDDHEEFAPRAADLLDKNACRYFVEVTYEVYYKKLKKYFGNTIIGFFTDEPDILGRNSIPNMLPFNKELHQRLIKKGLSLEDIAGLFFDLDNDKKRLYEKTVFEQMSENYYALLSNWCKKHGVILTGHPHESEDIGYLKYFQIPGQDIVWRWVAPENGCSISGKESVVAKCSSDAARHNGNVRNANECFGCCGYENKQWSFSPAEMKWYLDWLFIRGVNMIYPHAFFYSIRGLRKYERAPDVGVHNLWWPWYRYFSDYIKRMSYMMSNQVNQTNVAILAESCRIPHVGTEKLYENQIEFNYLEERFILDNLLNLENGFLKIREQKYNVLVLSKKNRNLNVLQNKLKDFIEQGGQLLLYENTLDEVYLKIKESYKKSISISGSGVKNLRYSHFIKDQLKFHAISNEGLEEVQAKFIFDTEVNSIEIWDPWKGEIRDKILENNSFEYKFYPNQLLFFLQKNGENSSIKEFANKKKEYIDVDIKIIDELGTERTTDCWTGRADTQYFSGSKSYYLKVNTQNLPDKIECFWLDLGDIKEFAVLKIDNKEKEVIFWKPYLFDISRNELMNCKLEIIITNTLTNLFEHYPKPSGILKPIRLMIEKGD